MWLFNVLFWNKKSNSNLRDLWVVEKVNFIVEITAPKQANLDYIMTVVKPISELGGTFYLLVPKSEKNHIEKICRENQIHPRYGVYFKQGNELKILFE